MNLRAAGLLLVTVHSVPVTALADDAACEAEAAAFAARLVASGVVATSEHPSLARDAAALCLRAAASRPSVESVPAPPRPEDTGPSWSDRLFSDQEETSGHRRLRRK